MISEHDPGRLTFTAPEYSDWECRLFGGDATGIVWRPLKGEEPNWFWRWMQFLCFGNRWRRRSQP